MQITHYQEQPQLLDPVLESLVRPLATLILQIAQPLETFINDSEAQTRLYAVSRLLWQLASVRGYKTVLKFFPNEVAAVEPAVALLDFLSNTTAGGASVHGEDPGQINWEAQYVMLMWLSLLAMIPFDLAIIDSSLGGTSTSTSTTSADAEILSSSASSCPPIAAKIMSLCRKFLCTPGPTREMAAVLAGRLVTRPDMHAALQDFVAWGVAAMQTKPSHPTNGINYDPSRDFLLPGVTLAFATVFKLGKRDALVPVALAVLPAAAELFASPVAASNALVRKLAVKLVQRAGLAFLPQRVAPWRYQQGKRATVNIGQTTDATTATALPVSTPLATANGNTPNEISQDHIPTLDAVSEDEDAAWAEDEGQSEAVEIAIESMLSALGDRDTVVRWSAAKGIGRLTGRLPRELGDEVVASVLSSFSLPTAGDSVWHGGCLALAELTRRGLLLPTRLIEAVPFVVQALEYDVRRGHCSVGAHVRDAASYVCWAIARAYSPETLGQAVSALAPALITAACFDREVNCRRAAAAAFQECVGRLGAFPYGIEILTAADYFTVSMRVAAYTSVAPHVASYPGYFEPLAWHLLRIKLEHWEKALRELAARALAALVPLHRTFFIEEAIPYLLKDCSNTTLETRHGAVAAVAELLPVVGASALTPKIAAQVADILPTIERLKLGKGKGGEIMRSALCRLVETTSLIGLQLSSKQQESLYAVAMENLHHPSPDIQQAAAVALSAFTDAYLKKEIGTADGTAERYCPSEPVVERLLRELQPGSTHSVTGRRGAALALGQLPGWTLRAAHAEVLQGLAGALQIEIDPGMRDVETRVNAAKALPRVVAAIAAGTAGDEIKDPNPLNSLDNAPLTTLVQERVLIPLLGALEDYATDNRGDVGSWVREAAMHAVHDVLSVLGPEKITNSDGVRALAQNAMALFARQATERIGRVRETAGTLIQNLVSLLIAAHVPAASIVGSTLSGLSGEDFATGKALPALARLIELSEMRSALLQGLAFSAGGLDAQLAEAAGEALVDAIGSLGNDNVELITSLGDSFTALWFSNSQSPRMALPLLQSAELLLNRTDLPLILRPPTSDFAEKVLKLTLAEVQGCKDVPRLHAAAGALCALAATTTGSVKREALAGALALVGNRYPKVRRYAAEQLYTTLLAWEDEEEGSFEEDKEEGDLEAEQPGSIDIDAAMELLSETAWDGAAAVVRLARLQLYACLGIAAPVQVAGEGPNDARNSSAGVQNSSYAALLQHVERGL